DFVFARVESLRESGVIRQLSANFWAKKLGFVSTLCGAKVEDNKLSSFVELVNSYPGVTHNYLRKHEYNVWFTLISPSSEQNAAILAEITAKTGVDILNLPAKKIFKIQVNFAMQKQDTDH
ncbi:MAG: Lrp/AsnC family transcriptional regulator, partial [Desulfovibrio sp.]|nr:Lrp/AsnC family transcriptional regulator [Desulfovibrio sp.]